MPNNDSGPLPDPSVVETAQIQNANKARIPLRQRAIVRAAGLALTVTAASGIASGIERYNSTPMHNEGFDYDNLHDGNGLQDYCPPAPSAEEIVKLEQNFNKYLVSFDLLTAKKEAETKGLHFADPKAAAEQIALAATPESATAVLSSFSKENFGFNINLDLPANKLKSDKEFGKYKADLRKMAAYMSAIPEELLNSTQIANISIIDFSNADNIIGNYSFEDKRVKLDFKNIGTPAVFIHEVIGHGVSGTSCNGYGYKDAALLAQNPDSFHYTHNSEESSKLPSKAYNSITASAYGTVNVLEDEATLIEFFLVGNLTTGTSAIYDEQSPASKKLAVILDRIDSLAPGSVNYFEKTRVYFYLLEQVGVDIRKTTPIESNPEIPSNTSNKPQTTTPKGAPPTSK